jgi:DHHC palmitoyltransferase
MDHHCPLVLTCVGYNNHKAFYLNLFYHVICTGFGAISGLLWMYYILPELIKDYKLIGKLWIIVLILADIAGVLAFFTFALSMFVAHAHLIQTN